MNILTQNIMKKVLLATIFWVATLPAITQASFVRIETTLGDINIELFDTVAPNTVANFMNYVNDGDYVNSFFHRSASLTGSSFLPPDILQGGGFTHDSSNGYGYVPADASIVNEYSPLNPNSRGSLAMAKLGGNPDSATSQWFFNLVDNSTTLGDTNNGGFTVFGQVIGNGMDVVDAIAALPRYDLRTILNHSALGEVPLNGVVDNTYYSSQLVMVNSVSAVPVPAAVWLFGSGLMGLIAVARRRAGSKGAGN
ncbi:MAG: peptidylprolyl isomerase [Gammaproteobacteria bacterium]|nr:peptidylprolyl isomerase [Gammaproteobacteria bacterium]